MKRSLLVWVLVLGGLLLFTCLTWAAKLRTGEIKPGEYPTVAITNHLPETFRKTKEYWDSQQLVELTVGGQNKFKDLPELGMKQPYTGFIQLGDMPKKFGVIVDIVGNEKRLYIDRDGDNSFANENWYPLLNEWYGLELYSVWSPEPMTLKVPYNSQVNQDFPIEIQVTGVLFKPGPFYKGKPNLRILVRTWFFVKLMEGEFQKLAAIVDRNNNGCYNDPEDAIYVDVNDDSFFSDDEMAIRTKSGITITSGKEKRPVIWEAYPDKIMVGGNIH